MSRDAAPWARANGKLESLMVIDVNGLKITKGDLVAPISGDLKGRVCELKVEDGLGFVCVRASHRPYSKGVWYSADHVQRLQQGKPRKRPAPPVGKGRGAH